MPATDGTDWRAFVPLKARAFDRFVATTLAGVAERARVPNDGQNPVDRLRALRDYLAERDRIERACFDGHARSRMSLQLLALVAAGLVDESDLEAFGENLRATVTPRRPSPNRS